MKNVLLAMLATMIFATAPLSSSFAADDEKTTTTKPSGDKKPDAGGEPDCD